MKCVYHQKNKFSSKIALRSIIVNLSRSLSFQNALRMEKAAAVGKVKKYKTKKKHQSKYFLSEFQGRVYVFLHLRIFLQ